MKKAFALGTVLAALVALAPMAFSAPADDAYDQSYARLSFVSGDISVERASNLGEEAGEVNLPVVEGDKVVARSGQAEIQFGRRNFLRLDSSSEALFASLPKRGDDRVKIHLLSGQAYLRVTTLEGEKAIEVDTPDASFYVLEEGLYRIDVAQGGGSEILVHEGSAEAAGEKGSVVVNAKERVRAEDGDLGAGPETFYASSDGFDGWNAERDSLLERRASGSYLPSTLSDYENDLEDNGRWVREASYGYVWVPYVQDVEWRPYLFGRWVWYPIIGWTWVSSEPWGWCTYHYGRWHWGFDIGWYWIPTSHWGPAWVHWYHGHDHWGWCPLSYYGYPGVIIGNRYYDRWNGGYYPYNSRALTVIHRDRLQAHGISRHALRPSQIEGLGRITLSAAQPEIKPLISRSSASSRTLGRTISGSGVRTTLAERNASSGGLKKLTPGSVSGTSSGIKTWGTKSGTVTAGGLSRAKSGSFGAVKAYPSQGGQGTGASSGGLRSLSSGRVRSSVVKERPAGLSTKGITGGIKSYAPSSTARSMTGTSKSLSGLGVKRYSPSTSGGTGAVRSYTPSSSIKSYGARSSSSQGSTRRYVPSSSSGFSGRSSVGSASRLRSYGSGSLSSRSYSGPSYSPRSYSSQSLSRSFTPSVSSRSYSSSSRPSGSFSRSSSSKGFSLSRSSGSSRGGSFSFSRSSSSHVSLSSGRSGSIRRR